MRRFFLFLGVASTVIVTTLVLLFLALQAPRLDAPPQQDWIFSNVTLVEAGRAPRAGVTLHIQDGRITHQNHSSTAVNEKGVKDNDASDLAGLFVTPGLTDLHVHYPPKIAVGNPELWSLLLLAHGVTSIRETGSIDGSIFDIREDIRRGHTPGPRIFACGAMLDGQNPSFPSNRVIVTPEQGRTAVAELAAQGADCIKAYNMLSRETLAAILDAANEADLPVIGHAPHSVSLEEAGLVDLQHGTGAVVVDLDKIGRSDFRDADWSTMDEARIATVARISLSQDIAHTPTLVNARMRRLLVEGQPVDAAIAGDTGLRHLPRYWAMAWGTIWDAPFVGGDAEGEAQNELFRTRQARMTARLHEAGVRIHAGTDTLMPYVAPGSSLHGELAMLNAAGIAPNDVWEIATRAAGEALGLGGLGTLDLGAPADLLFLRSNPEDNLAAFSEIEAVLADGRLYRRADIEAMLTKTDAHFRGPFYEAVMQTVVSFVQGRFAPEGGGGHGFGESG